MVVKRPLPSYPLPTGIWDFVPPARSVVKVRIGLWGNDQYDDPQPNRPVM